MPSGSEATAFAEPSSERTRNHHVGFGRGCRRGEGEPRAKLEDGAALPEKRFQTTSGWPARLMLAAIAAPILPSPMKATVNSSVGDSWPNIPSWVIA